MHIFILIFICFHITNGQHGATVRITPTQGQLTAGTLRLTRVGHGINIKGILTGLLPGDHGFHVHEKGDIGNNCANAGGHFNPLNKKHGGPLDFERHAGDLGNVVGDSHGNANIDITDFHISLDPSSEMFIGGLAIVIHAGADDLGRGGNDESLRTGNAGARIGCGRIMTDTPPHERANHGFQRLPTSPSMLTHQSSASQQTIDSEVLKSQQIPAPHGVHRAVVEFVPGVNKTSGSLSLMPTKSGILIKGKIFGLSPGLHGFHVHQNGRTTSMCTDAGGHFNPFEKTHGSPESTVRHVGDLGNVFADEYGVANIEIFDDHASLDPMSPAYVGGRSLVVHVSADDLGRGPNQESLSTGNAGARAGCGIIKVIPDETPSSGFPFHNEQFGSDFSSLHGPSATSNIVPGSGKVSGRLEITDEIHGIRIKGTIEGLTPGLHGFHVHDIGAITNKCLDAGGHFNPFQRTHGDPKGRERHAGDLGNVLADSHGVAHIDIRDDHVSLDSHSETFIGGRAFVVHAEPDDLGRGRDDESLRTGNAGARLGCGIIEMKDQGFGDFEFHSGFPDSQFKPDGPDFASQRQEATFVAIPEKQTSGSDFPLTNVVAMASVVPGSDLKIQGDFSLTEKQGGVVIKGRVSGLSPGLHGFHVHEHGLLGNKCVDAGGHFNPFDNSHGDPDSSSRHVGDLGNILADDNGVANVEIFDNLISLDPKSGFDNRGYIVGRALVIHEKPDDLGRGGNPESLRTGNAGSRLGCALIVTQERQPQFSAPERAVPHASNSQQNVHARVQILPGGDLGVHGTLELSSDRRGVNVRGKIEGLSPGLHGFHVHQKGDIGNKCVAAGGHFNPFEKNHGSPNDQHRHVGDLGNIKADERGVANINFYDSHISLDPLEPSYIGGRAFVVHAQADDLGRGPNPESLKTGNAGSRVGCGIVEVLGGSSVSSDSSISIPFVGLPSQSRLPFQGSLITSSGLPSQVSLPSQSGVRSPQTGIFEGQKVTSFQHQSFPGERQQQQNLPLARAIVFLGPGKDPRISGELTLDQTNNGVIVKGVIQGLNPGFHGFHVHQNPGLGNQCSDAGGHFNPHNRNHGSPDTLDRHVGDLGNIFADNRGIAILNFLDNHISLDPNSQAFIGNRAIVVHEKPDDLGRGGNSESLKTGNAGARLGCGLVEIQQTLRFPDHPIAKSLVHRPVYVPMYRRWRFY